MSSAIYLIEKQVGKKVSATGWEMYSHVTHDIYAFSDYSTIVSLSNNFCNCKIRCAQLEIVQWTLDTTSGRSISDLAPILDVTFTESTTSLKVRASKGFKVLKRN